MKLGKEFPWLRPDVCPHCGGNHLWGHGYTPRYFDGYSKKVWLKRYRCVDCHRVHTLRPDSYWRRFQATTTIIIESLKTKILENRWVPGLSRQRQQYWFRGFRTQLKVNHPSDGMLTFERLKDLLSEKVIIATHSLNWFQMLVCGAYDCVPKIGYV